MKVLVTLDLTDPRHVQIFDELRGPVAPPEYTNAIASPAGPAVAVAPGAAVAPQAAAAAPGSMMDPRDFAPGPERQPAAAPAPTPLANQAPLQPLPGQSSQQAIQAANAPVAPAVPASVPQPTQASLPTPLTDLQAKLQALYGELFTKDPQAARGLGEKFRREFDPNSKNWTQDQLQQACSEMEATLRF